MADHKCHRATGCICSSQRMEPDDNCPQHGCNTWPPRCEVCGKFLPQIPAKEVRDGD